MRALKKLGWETLEPYHNWYLDGQFKGYKWVLDGLTFMTIHGTGHMAALWKPGLVREIVELFIADAL